jgi:hypothetical protein
MALQIKMGGNPKQFAILGVLSLVLVYLVYSNYSGDSSVPDRPAPPPAAPAPVAVTTPIKKTEDRRRAQLDRRAQEFRPRVGPARPEDRPDPMTVDPTLRLDLLARLEKVHISGGMRSLFDFSNVPVVSNAPIPKIIPAAQKPVAPKPFIGPMPEPPKPPKPVVQAPVAPPIPLRFYGFASSPRGGQKRAFFLDGENIVVAAEGDSIKGRYKVIRIGLANVVMEDTQFKQQQTLPIVPDPTGGD